MKKRLLSAIFVMVFLLSSSAVANPLTAQHRSQYLNAYHSARSQYGAQIAGCDLLEKRGNCHMKITDEVVMNSLSVLERILNPPPPPSQPSPPAQPQSVSNSTGPPAQSQDVNTASSGNLESCIIQHESGGDPNAVSGQYSGIGQWSPEAWQQDGGTQYASSPTGASYAQQEQVLSSEGAAGMQQQQGNFDGC